MVKGVIFDMDGLMFDTERLWDKMWEPACKALGLPLPEDLAAFSASCRGLAGDNLRSQVAKYIPGDPQRRTVRPGRALQKGPERAADRAG